jgi:hypothetical protein
MSMKLFLIAACIAGFSVSPGVALGQADCDATVKAHVAVATGEFSLADLLARNSCPELLRAAAGVRLGRAPLTGSVRVLEADEVRFLFQKVARSIPNRVRGTVAVHVPERVTVRRAEARASCADIGRQLLGPPDARPAVLRSGLLSPARPATAPYEPELQCGVGDRIPQWSVLERTRRVWNPALNSWDVSLRCVHRQDCVPFLVRVRNRNAPREIALTDRPATPDQPTILIASASPFQGGLSTANTPLVRRGETVRLLWDQYGVRLAIPAISLDPGDEGQRVRARIVRGGRIMSAIVVSAGELRTAF